MQTDSLFKNNQGLQLEKEFFYGWRLRWPHNGGTIMRDLFIDDAYAQSLAAALGLSPCGDNQNAGTGETLSHG